MSQSTSDVSEFDFHYEYGKAKVVGYSQTTNHRYDLYVSNRDGETVAESVMCADRNDRTPMHDSLGKGYDSQCNCCYLNFTHTEGKHKQSISEHIQSEKAYLDRLKQLAV